MRRGGLDGQYTVYVLYNMLEGPGWYAYRLHYLELYDVLALAILRAAAFIFKDFT